MAKLRQWDGPSGFPRRGESRIRHVRHRAFVDVDLRRARHGASPRRSQGESHHVVAVIGDGAMSAGMAFEALNNAQGANLLVILNDNEMSISRAGRRVQQLPGQDPVEPRSTTRCAAAARKCSRSCRPCTTCAKRWEEHMKGMLLPGTLFEEFGFNYIGPIDGHDLDDADRGRWRTSDELHGPQFLHVITKKGYGYPKRRRGPDPLPRRRRVRPGGGHRSQAAGAGRRTRRCSATGCATWRRATRAWSASRRRCAKAPGLVRFSQEFPDRYFDVGIAEQHAVTFAAGLGVRGPAAGRRDLLDVPAARLRPAGPRRRTAEPAGAVRRRPRGRGRRRRRHAHRRVRPRLPALPAEHDR